MYFPLLSSGVPADILAARDTSEARRAHGHDMHADSPALTLGIRWGSMSKTVYVVDPVPDERRRAEVALANEPVGIESFDSAERFLESLCPNASGCVLAPSDLPGMGTRALIEEVQRRHLPLSVVVVGRESDVATAVEMIRAGATDFLECPLSDRRLRLAVRRAMSVEV